MTSLPTLSVVIPTRNRVALLPRAVESALEAEAEVIVVDDASTDSTSSLMRARRHAIRYERLETNRGPCFARNVGIGLASGELILFLDDDDILLPEGGEIVRQLAREYREYDLYLHNCLYPDGQLSLEGLDKPVEVTYEAWLGGDWDFELKPVARRTLFNHYSYDDTQASGEGLLWGRVVRDRKTLSGPAPVVMYDTRGADRLTSAAGLLRHASANAAISRQWLVYFGGDLKERHPDRWVRRVVAAALYSIMSGERAEGRRLMGALPAGLLRTRTRAALRLTFYMPLPLLRFFFLVHRRELLATARSHRLWNVLLG